MTKKPSLRRAVARGSRRPAGSRAGASRLLKSLTADLAAYRAAFGRLIELLPQTARGWRRLPSIRRALSEVHIAAARLYLDYLLVAREQPELWAVSVDRGGAPCTVDWEREMVVRQTLKRRLEFAPWGREPNAFAELTGLRSPRDYRRSLSLHLPEIYGETLRVEECIKQFLAGWDSRALADITVGLQHLARNHALFALQALEWAVEPGED